MAEQTDQKAPAQPIPPKGGSSTAPKKTPTPFVDAAARVQAQIDADAAGPPQADARPGRGLSPELAAMRQVERLLAGLGDPHAASRVAAWAYARWVEDLQFAPAAGEGR